MKSSLGMFNSSRQSHTATLSRLILEKWVLRAWQKRLIRCKKRFLSANTYLSPPSSYSYSNMEKKGRFSQILHLSMASRCLQLFYYILRNKMLTNKLTMFKGRVCCVENGFICLFRRREGVVASWNLWFYGNVLFFCSCMKVSSG